MCYTLLVLGETAAWQTKEGENMMKVLINLSRSPNQRYLVSLLTKELIKEVTCLINDRKHTEAMITAFRKGTIERELNGDDERGIDADLILSATNARWDIKKR